MKTSIEQTKALEEILLQLQLSAARVSDSDFKKVGTKDLMKSIQDCKKLIDLSKELSIYEAIEMHTDSLYDYGTSLGIHNL